jgi:SH3 domain-containing protein
MDGATEKLELGLQRLAKAGDDADMLGLALQSIHGALEDHFRARLSVDSHMPAEQRAAMADPKQTQWRDLLDAMQLYGELSAPNRELIWRTNTLRTKVAHGGRYTGSRADMERYAALARSLCGYPADAKPAALPQPRAPAEKPIVKPTGARSVAAPDIPRAVRAGTLTSSARPRSPWPGGLLALALLLSLAAFAVLRSAPSPRAESAAAPTALATAAPATQAPVAAPAIDLPPTPLPRAATVTAQDGLNLRSDHNSSAALLGTLPSGTRVTIVGEPVQADGYTWWNVEVDGRRGWCAGEFLSFDTT